MLSRSYTQDVAKYWLGIMSLNELVSPAPDVVSLVTQLATIVDWLSLLIADRGTEDENPSVPVKTTSSAFGSGCVAFSMAFSEAPVALITYVC